MSKISQLQGTPYHIESLHTNDERRHKVRCKHYEVKNYCLYAGRMCYGSTHCSYYFPMTDEEFTQRQKERKLKAQQFEKQKEAPNIQKLPEISKPKEAPTAKRLSIDKCRITDAYVDAIVCSSDVRDTIFSVAGKKMKSAKTGCEFGAAIITGGYNLKQKYVIHTKVPDWISGNKNEIKLLYSSYLSALGLARQYGCKSVAFSLIGIDKGYPLNEAWKKAIKACSYDIEKHPNSNMRIVFAIHDDDVRALGEQTLLRYKQKSTDNI